MLNSTWRMQSPNLSFVMGPAIRKPSSVISAFVHFSVFEPSKRTTASFGGLSHSTYSPATEQAGVRMTMSAAAVARFGMREVS